MDSLRRGRTIAGGAGIALLAATAALATWPHWSDRPGAVLALGAIAAAAYLVLARLAVREDAGRLALLRPRGMLLFALCLRAVPFASEPWSSDDVHRYLWEGRVQRAGESPYLHPPDDPLLEPLRDENWESVAHRSIPAVYPPLAQALFRGTPGGLWGWKTLVLGADLLVLAVLLAALRRRGRTSRAALYAFHPLIVAEFAGAAHLDAVALALGALALGAILRRREVWGAALAGAACLVKPPAAAVLAPLLARRRLLPLAAAGLVVAAGLAPVAREGPQIVRGLQTYGARWEFGGLGYPVLRGGLEHYKEHLESLPHTRATRAQLEFGWRLQPHRDARRLAALAFLIGAGLWAIRWRHRPLECCLGVLVAFLACSPTVYPWYVAALVPFLPFVRSRALMALSLCAPAAAWVPAVESVGGGWSEPGWLRWLVWTPAVVLFALEGLGRRGLSPLRSPAPRPPRPPGDEPAGRPPAAS